MSIEVVQKGITDKVQVQIKGNNYSKSFTVRGLSVDYLFSLFLTIAEKLSKTPLNQVSVTCYKPGIENDEIHVY